MDKIKFLRLPAVQKRVPYSRSQIYLMISKGEFPAPVKIGPRASAWDESEIDEYCSKLIEKSRRVQVAA